jgi:hypothetical protein
MMTYQGGGGVGVGVQPAPSHGSPWWNHHAATLCCVVTTHAPMLLRPSPPLHPHNTTPTTRHPAPPQRHHLALFPQHPQAQEHRGLLYGTTPPPQLAWGWRWPRLLADIASGCPDVVCLQEVDRWGDVARDMASLG